MGNSNPSSLNDSSIESQRGDAGVQFGLALITIVTPAKATPSVSHAKSTSLSVLGDDVVGESLLRYTWAVVAGPSSAEVHFPQNGCNAAKNITVTFSQPGRYTFACTISNGLIGIVSSVEVLVEEQIAQLAA